MSVPTSTSADPVETVVDLLSDDDATWANGTEPSIVETYWTSDAAMKINRADDAIYVRSPEIGDWTFLSAEQEDKDERQTVAAEVWSTEQSRHDDMVGDAIAILEDFVDSTTANANTEWRKITPQSENDMRQDHVVRRTDHYVTQIIIELRREASIGT